MGAGTLKRKELARCDRGSVVETGDGANDPFSRPSTRRLRVQAEEDVVWFCRPISRIRDDREARLRVERRRWEQIDPCGRLLTGHERRLIQNPDAAPDPDGAVGTMPCRFPANYQRIAW